MKSIILCADDYGQTPAISQAIIQLLQQKRLSATSCLTTSSWWRQHAQWLKVDTIHADIGLHFNLTEGKPLSPEASAYFGGVFESLPSMLKRAYLKKVSLNVILAEVNAQIDEFEAGMGHLPDYLDGHQHVHQLPIIRDAVLAVYNQRLRSRPGSYIRCVTDPKAWLRVGSDAYLKRIIIQLCGASALKSHLLQQNIRHNASFAGIYDFKRSKSYATLFAKFLEQVTDDGLIMCHPGLDDSDLENDAIFYSRRDEYQYLLSADFLDACQKHQVVLNRFTHNDKGESSANKR
jgi:predicted glycoside hydrolase/deacetylase ChbG (UPF0249 family)